MCKREYNRNEQMIRVKKRGGGGGGGAIDRRLEFRTEEKGKLN